MRILLTGSSGMVGKNLLEHVNASKFLFITPSHSDLDLNNYNQVEKFLINERPDLVIHSAGKVGGIQANIAQPVSFLVENLEMGKNVLMASYKAGIKKLINLGSSCMYPRNAENPLQEKYILEGELEPTNEGYALAKVAVAKLCEYINREDASFKYKTVIPCNLYGKYDKFDPSHSHLIPAVIHKLHLANLKNLNDVKIWGDGQVRREFMCASDFADFLIKAIDDFDRLPNIMNVGLGFDYTIDEYYQIIAEVVKYKGTFSHDLTKPVGMRQKLVSIEKLKEWGWQSGLSLKDGIQSAYEYYLKEYFHESKLPTGH